MRARAVEASACGDRLDPTMAHGRFRLRSQLTPSDALAKSRGTMPIAKTPVFKASPQRGEVGDAVASTGEGAASLRDRALSEQRRSRTAVTVVLSIGLAALGLAAPGNAQAAGSVKGTVKLVGKAPEPATVNMKADPFCAKQPASKDEEVVVGPGGALKNVVVRVAKGVASPPPPPTTPAVIDQNGCRYVPRVQVVQAGQSLEIRNSDATLHNVHTYKGTATLFNQAHIQGSGPIKKKFPTVGDVIRFKCDVHPWMTAYLLVTDNPFYAISGDDGSFTIANVPPGKYTLEIWHEKLGSQTKEVTVAEGAPAQLDLQFNAK
jgi:plastocyanin